MGKPSHQGVPFRRQRPQDTLGFGQKPRTRLPPDVGCFPRQFRCCNLLGGVCQIELRRCQLRLDLVSRRTIIVVGFGCPQFMPKSLSLGAGALLPRHRTGDSRFSRPFRCLCFGLSSKGSIQPPFIGGGSPFRVGNP